jgi:hypothetical protein
LPKADRRRFQESSTGAERRFAVHTEEIEMRLRIAAPPAALAFDQRVGAMKFHQAIRCGAREPVQSVDILRQHQA